MYCGKEVYWKEVYCVEVQCGLSSEWTSLIRLIRGILFIVWRLERVVLHQLSWAHMIISEVACTEDASEC